MTEKVRKLRADRAKIVADQRALLDKAEAEKRALTGDEDNTYRNMDADVDKFGESIEREERLVKREKEMVAYVDGIKPEPASQRSSEPTFLEYRGMKIQLPQGSTPESRAAFTTYLSRGSSALSAVELRALQADADIYGGFLVAPVQMVMRLIQAVDNQVFIRQMATVFPVTKAESLGAPSLDNQIADPTWTAEIATGTEDSSLTFGKRELTPHPLAKLIKVSEKLLRVAAMDVESIVIDRLAYKFAVVQENAFMTGTGAGQPVGIFTPVAVGVGISTARDVSTGNTTTSMTTDGLINGLYSLKAQYHPKASWIFHRDGVKMLRKLKDGEGQYIWNPGLQAGQPDIILGRPYKMSEYAPNTFTTGKYVGIIGDFSQYWIADALDMRVQRLNELYAATNQIGFIGRMESDAMPVLEEAFARITLA